MKPAIVVLFLSLFLTSSIVAHEAPSTSVEKLSYIKDKMLLFETEAKIINTYGGSKPGVRFSIKNKGKETLTGVDVIVYFLDKNGEPFFDKTFYPISEYASVKSLKPNYTFRNDKDEFYTIDNLGDEWSGNVTWEISDIEFAE